MFAFLDFHRAIAATRSDSPRFAQWSRTPQLEVRPNAVMWSLLASVFAREVGDNCLRGYLQLPLRVSLPPQIGCKNGEAFIEVRLNVFLIRTWRPARIKTSEKNLA